MKFSDFLMQFGPVWAPTDDPAGDPPAGDPPAGNPPADPPAGDPPAGDPAGDPPPSDPPAAKKWFEDARFDEKQKTYLSERGLNQIEDPLDALQKVMESHRSAIKVGRNPDNFLPKPAEGQSTTDWLKENGMLTLPESADGYETKRPELPEGMKYDEAGEAKLRAWAFETGASGEQVQGLVNLYGEIVGEQLNSAAAEYQTANAELTRDLEKDWGDQMKAKTTLAAQAAQSIAGAAGVGENEIALMAQAFKDKGVGDAATIRIFAKIGEMMADDSLPAPGGGSQTLGMTPQEAQQKLDQMRQPDSEYMRARNSGNKAALAPLEAERKRLIRVAAGGGSS